MAMGDLTYGTTEGLGDHLWQPYGLVLVDHPQQRILPQMIWGTYFAMGDHLWHDNTMQGTCMAVMLAFVSTKPATKSSRVR